MHSDSLLTRESRYPALVDLDLVPERSGESRTPVEEEVTGKKCKPTGDEETALLLTVTPEDIEKMDHFFNEEPMCDLSSQNAVAISLRRLFPSARRVQVTWIRGHAHGRVDDILFPLGWKVTRWLIGSVCGREVEPHTWVIPVPHQLVSEKLP